MVRFDFIKWFYVVLYCIIMYYIWVILKIFEIFWMNVPYPLHGFWYSPFLPRHFSPGADIKVNKVKNGENRWWMMKQYLNIGDGYFNNFHFVSKCFKYVQHVSIFSFLVVYHNQLRQVSGQRSSLDQCLAKKQCLCLRHTVHQVARQCARLVQNPICFYNF